MSCMTTQWMYPGCNQCIVGDNTIAAAISYLFIAENWLQVEGSWIAWFLTFSFRLVPITSFTLSFASFHYSLMAVSQCLTLNKSPVLPDSHGWRQTLWRGGSSSLSLLSTRVAIDLRCTLPTCLSCCPSNQWHTRVVALTWGVALRSPGTSCTCTPVATTDTLRSWFVYW